MRYKLLIWVLGMFMFAGGVPPLASAAEPVVLRVVGSTTVLPVVSRAAERFTALKNGAVSITVNAGGSGVGINSVANGRADIGMVSREVSPLERKRYARSDLLVQLIGRDAVACVISSEVYSAGIRVLSKKQIADIYLGKIRNWKKLGGPDRRIVVIDKEHHRGTRHVFMRYILGDETARAPGARLVTGSNNEEQAKLAQSDSAIGMLSVAWINEDVRGVGILEGKDVIEPTPQNIRSGRYPISRNLNLVTAGEPRGLVKEFIEFIMGPQGREFVKMSGYLPPGKARSKMAKAREAL